MNEILARLLHGLLSNLLDFLFQIIEALEQKVLGDASEDLRDLWVRDGELLPIYEPCFRSFREQGYIHPAQLSGQDLGDYALCLLAKDYALYRCRNQLITNGELPADGSCDEFLQNGNLIWQSRNWAPNLALYFPDLSPLPTWDGIDPFDPTVFTQDYLSGIWLPIWNQDSLPYLTASEITDPPRGSQETPNASRVALAQATLDFWWLLGLEEFADPAYLAAWINRYEHGGAIDNNPEALEYMSQVIYATYLQADNSQYYDQLPLFMSGWSVTLFTQRTVNNQVVEGRTFSFWERLLTPLTDEELAIFGNQELWEDMPSIDELDIDTTATRTFGSTELSRGLRRPFHADISRYTRVFPSHTVNDTDYSEDNSYVYVMTPCQFNNAHASKDVGQLLELDC